MLISMMKSKKCKQKECCKKISEMIWKMPERSLIKKKPKDDKNKYITVKFVDQYA